MRTNEKDRFIGSALANSDGFHLQNLLERDAPSAVENCIQESGVDHTVVPLLKRELDRG